MNKMLLILTLVGAAMATRPNIVFILTDDQDIVLGGEFPLAKSKLLIGNQGITFINAFASTPLCCPSRSTILTGLYLHNHRTVNNSISGHCSSPSWQNGPEKHSFATYLKKQNYTTFYAGKYLNQYGEKECGGVAHIPPGWDHWFGLKGNSRYYNYTLSVNGKAEHHGDSTTDYLTDVISKRATNFLSKWNKTSDPFFMMLATPACHAPFTPTPKYAKAFSGKRAPRSRNFNVSGNPTKHWLLRQAHALTDDTGNFMDKIFRNRWRTLLSVDDLVESIIHILASRDLLNNTYVMLASDNGFHLGQFSLPYDKRHLYEEDIRIPLMVRGPGIAPGRISQAAVVSTDFAPTFVDLAGLAPPPAMDGVSFVPLLKKPNLPWRTAFLVEYRGEGKTDPTPGCPQFDQGGVKMCTPECICEDAWNNTYTCIRTMTNSQSTMFCQFEDHENFLEFYNINLDPYQLDNLAFDANRSSIDVFWKMKELQQLQHCKGQSCIVTW